MDSLYVGLSVLGAVESCTFRKGTLFLAVLTVSNISPALLMAFCRLTVHYASIHVYAFAATDKMNVAQQIDE